MPQLHLQWLALFIVLLKWLYAFWCMAIVGIMVNVSQPL